MTEEQIKGWGLKELRPVKDWIVKDFTPYRIKGQHLLSQVAFLCHEVDPAFDQSGNTWWIHPFFRNKFTAPYFRKIGTNEIYPRTEIATPPTEHNDATRDWKGIPPWERHSEPLVQGDDMEPYLGPLGPIDNAKKQGVYHATELEMEYHEIWSKIKNTYDYLLIGAKGETLTVQDTGVSEVELSATMDALRKFLTEYLTEYFKEKPKFLFPREDGATNGQDDFIHGPDFRSATWKEEQYSFTPMQAQIIEILYSAFQSGTPEVSKDYILVELNSPAQRLRDVFKKHPAWDRLVIKGSTKGTYRLNF